MDEGADIRFFHPPPLEARTYANALQVWFTDHGLTLGWAVTTKREEEGETIAEVVARVHIPTTIAFDVVRWVNASLTEYERRYGEVRRPGEGCGAA